MICYGSENIHCLNCGDLNSTHVFYLDQEYCLQKQAQIKDNDPKFIIPQEQYAWLTSDRISRKVFETQTLILNPQDTFISGLAINTLRSNIMFVDPTSTSNIEQGSLNHPYKNFTLSLVETFNSYYDSLAKPTILIAFEQTSLLQLQGKLIIDHTDIIVTTYNKSSKTINYLGSIFSGTLPSQAMLQLKQPIMSSTESLYSLCYSQSYEYKTRLPFTDQRISLNLITIKSYSSSYFNLYDGSINLQNFILQLQDRPNPYQPLVSVIYGGYRNSFTLYNFETLLSIQILKSYTQIDVKIRYSKFNLQLLKQSLIEIKSKDSYCDTNSFLPSFEVKHSTFTGTLDIQEDAIFKINSFTSVLFSDNTLTSSMLKSPIIKAEISTVCQSTQTQIEMIISRNNFQFAQIQTSKNVFDIESKQAKSSLQLLIVGNDFSHMKQEKGTFINEVEYAGMGINAIINVQMNNFTQSGEDSQFVKIQSKSTIEKQIELQNLTLVNSQIDKFIEINSAQANIIISFYQLNQVQSSSNFYQPRFLLHITQAKTLQIDQLIIKNNTFKHLSPIQIQTITALTLDTIQVQNNTIQRHPLIMIEETESISIKNGTFANNLVQIESNAAFMKVNTLNPSTLSALLIQDVTSKIDQLPLIQIDFLKSKNTLLNHTLIFKNIQMDSLKLLNHHYLHLGASNTQNFDLQMSLINFTSSQSDQLSLIYLEVNTLKGSISQITFLNNIARLMDIEPKQKFAANNYDLSLSSTSAQFTMQGNKHSSKSLIEIKGRVHIQIKGSLNTIKDNYALTKNGMITLADGKSLLEIEGVNFTDNYAHYGGIFGLFDGGTVVCTQCSFYNNLALRASIANIYNNGRISLITATIGTNNALYNQLFSFSNSIRQQSIFQDVSFVSQLSKASLSVRKTTISTALETKFPGQTVSELESEYSGQNQDFNYYWVQNAQIQFLRCIVKDHIRFISSRIDSNIIIESSSFSHASQSDYLLRALISTITITKSTFSNILRPLNLASIFYLFEIMENTVFKIQSDTNFISVEIPLIQSYRSSISISDTTMTNVNHNDGNLFISQLSKIQISSLSLVNITNSNPNVAILYFLDESDINIYDLDLKTFNSRALDIADSIGLIDQLSVQGLDEVSALALETGSGLLVQNSNLEMKNSIFNGLKSSLLGGAVYFTQSKSERLTQLTKAKISNSTFESCTSTQGGAIYADNANLQINNSTFNLNEAKEGGALYFSCCQDCDIEELKFICEFSFDNSKCTSNTAETKGGCYFTDLYQITNYSSSTYTNNSANYGLDKASYAFNIIRVIYNGTTQQWIETTEALLAVSGQQITSPFFFAVIDMYDQIINIENSAIGNTEENGIDDLVIEFQDQDVSNDGIFSFEYTLFKSKPGYEGNFSFGSEIVNQNFYKLVTGEEFQVLVVNLELRLCTLGEAIEGQICSVCQAGTYSLIENADTCLDCPDHATCKEAQINPDLGYWRSSNVSQQVTKCYYNFACPGGGIQVCDSASGYTGILCHECIYEIGVAGSQFTRDGDHKCAKCPNTEDNIRIYMLYYIGTSIYTLFLATSNYENLVKEKEGTVLLKIFTTYTQIVQLISSFDLYWPSLIQEFFDAMAAPQQVTEALYSVDCIMREFEITDPVQQVTVQLLITTLQPFLQFTIQILFFFVLWIFRQKNLKLKMFITMIQIYTLSYPKIVKDTFSLFTCTPSIDGVKYLVKNTYLECFSSQHIKLVMALALPNMIFWIFGIPLLVLYQLYKRRHQLNDESNLRMFGFWYMGCKRNVFFWEIAQEFKKLMLVSVTVDVTGMGQSYQAFLMLMILYTYFILSSNLKPYKTPYLNKVSYYSELAQLCTFAFMMVFLRSSDNIVIDNLIFVLLLMMNSLYLMRFIYYFLRFQLNILLGHWRRLRDRIKKVPHDTEEDKSDKDSDYDKHSDQVEVKIQQEQVAEAKRKRKQRKIPTGAIYRVNQDKNQPTDLNRNASSSTFVDKASSSNHDNISEHDKIQQKIESIRILKDKKKQQKRKMLIQDGPVSIKIDDYIREEKMRMKQQQQDERKENYQRDKTQQEEQKKEDQALRVKDFELNKDKDGRLFNADNLEKLKRLL